MKRLFKILTILLTLFMFIPLLISSKSSVKALTDSTENVPYSTYTLGTDNRLVKTQTAYIPVGNLTFSYSGEELPLTQAQDIYYKANTIYVANSMSKMVFISDMNGNVSRVVKRLYTDSTHTETINLKNPTGIFEKDSYLYIADKDLQSVFKVNADDEIELTITKPESELYGKDTPYVPTKVAVGDNGTIYIVSEGTSTGVIEINYAGEFVGFLGINTVTESFSAFMYSLLYGNENTARTKPASPLNLALGEKSSILTINSTVNTETIKRLNIDGQNTFREDAYYPAVTLSDITMGSNNYIYAVSAAGDVYEYDRNGNLLFNFSVKDTSLTQILGLLSSPTGLIVDDNENIYILDSQYNVVTIYQKTIFVSMVHRAMNLYNEGKYSESKPMFEEILRQNTSFKVAHSALGMALYKEANYEAALEEFEIAKDKSGYSNAFWEIRNIYIQNNSGFIFSLIIGVIVLMVVVRILNKKTKVFVPLKEKMGKVKEKKLGGELTYAFHILKHPKDTYFGIKREGRASYLSATIIFLIFILFYIIHQYLQGYLFKQDFGRQGLTINVLIVAGVIILYVMMNFLISTLNDGEGKFRDIYVSTIYSLIPYIILILPLTFISHFLTYNEQVVYTLYMFVIYLWVGINLVLSISEIHNYGFFETIKCILLTAFAMVIFVLFVMLIYTFLSQLIDFISSIIKEVSFRA